MTSYSTVTDKRYRVVHPSQRDAEIHAMHVAQEGHPCWLLADDNPVSLYRPSYNESGFRIEPAY